MKFALAAAVLLLGTFSDVSALHAGAIRSAQSAGNQVEMATATPPIGYADLCKREPGQCRQWSGVRETITLSPSNWKLLQDVNRRINTTITAVSDQKHHGQAEFWTYPTDSGDCEDFVLLKQRTLIGHGLPENALLITVVLDEKGEGHAVLTAVTSDGDYILDNRRDEVRSWNRVNYTFLKRQSARDPEQWVLLNKDNPNRNQLTSTRAIKNQ